MPYQKLISACLAFLLAFYCYPVSCGSAFADETLVSTVSNGEGVGFDYKQGSQDSNLDSDIAGFGSGLSSSASSGDGYEVADDSHDVPSGDGVYSSDGIEPRVAPAVLLGWAGQALGAGASVTAIISGLNNLFGSPSGSSMTRIEALLTSILGWQYGLDNSLGTTNIRLLNLYNLVNQMYTNDFKGIYSLFSHIGVNTDLFKTTLNSINDRLYARNADGYTISHWVAGVYNHLGRVLTALGTSGSLYTLLNKYLGEIRDYSAGSYTRLASLISLLATEGDLYQLLNKYMGGLFDYSGGLYGRLATTNTILNTYLPKLAAPVVSFDDSNVLSYLSRILNALSENGAIAVAVSVDTSALQALREGELKAIYEQLLAMGSFAGDGVLAKLDEITDLLLIAGAKDLVETIVGDFSQITAAVQSSALDSVLQSAFPFCIPAVLKQLLGLLEYEAAAPVLDFEIGGHPMHVDASAAQGFADLVSWACRFLFLFGLLVSTRKFIYTGVAQ